jgi:hypothetical protein
MTTFEEFQATAVKVPLSLRNDRDRIRMPLLGLQEEAGKIGLLLAPASDSGRMALKPKQDAELRDRLSNVLWYVALLCGEAGVAMQDMAESGVALLKKRREELDPERR